MELTTLRKTETLREQTVEVLRNAIIGGQIQPGNKLVETQLAGQLGVSRGPLREAIRQLVEEGLVENVPYQGTYVKTLTAKDIEEIYSFRTALERFAFQSAWPRRNDDFFAEINMRHEALLNAIDSSESVPAIARELDLHGLVYEYADHQILLDTWTMLRSRVQVYFAFHQCAHNRHGSARDAHIKYIACAKGDSLESMLDEIKTHMQLGLDRLRQFVA
jgi:DNA-binding GntR family transcriptional regulator